MTYKISFVLACLIMASCNNKTDIQISDDTKPAIEIPVTSEVLLPEKGVAYAFVPNDAAQWLSQIIILSEDGDLYQAAANTREAKPISGPKVKSIVGVNRPGAPGLFLAINTNDELLAFIESNDEGDFMLSDKNSSDLNIVKLCEDSSALNCDVDKTGKITAAQVKSPTYLATDTGNISLTATQNGLAVSQINDPDTYKAVTITNGITIPGVPNPQSVYAASDNFGGPFNKGLVLVSDADEPRFALISADFARRKLADHVSE